MKKIFLFFLALSFSLLAKEVTVSIIPQKYFVEKIAKDKISVNVMVKNGFSPASYEPKTSQMKKLANSEVYFSTGVPFEKAWLKKFKDANNNLLIVDISEDIEKLPMLKHSHTEDYAEKHHNHKHHEDEGLDPHIWLDPILVKIQAKNIYKTLVKIDEANSQFYKTNYEDFIKELDSLNFELKEILTPVKHKTFMVFHPSWGYFAKRFHLKQIAVEIQGKEPKPNQLVELINEAKEHKIKIVFVSPQFSQKSAKVIANNIKADVVIIDPLVENWKDGLIKTAKQIANSYK